MITILSLAVEGLRILYTLQIVGCVVIFVFISKINLEKLKGKPGTPIMIQICQNRMDILNKLYSG